MLPRQQRDTPAILTASTAAFVRALTCVEEAPYGNAPGDYLSRRGPGQAGDGVGGLVSSRSPDPRQGCLLDSQRERGAHGPPLASCGGEGGPRRRGGGPGRRALLRPDCRA